MCALTPKSSISTDSEGKRKQKASKEKEGDEKVCSFVIFFPHASPHIRVRDFSFCLPRPCRAVGEKKKRMDDNKKGEKGVRCVYFCAFESEDTRKGSKRARGIRWGEGRGMRVRS